MEGMIRQEKSVCYWLVFDKVNEMFFQLSYQCLIPLCISKVKSLFVDQYVFSFGYKTIH